MCRSKNKISYTSSITESPISFTAERVELPAGQVPEEIQDNLIDAIFACQNGVTPVSYTHLESHYSC